MLDIFLDIETPDTNKLLHRLLVRIRDDCVAECISEVNDGEPEVGGELQWTTEDGTPFAVPSIPNKKPF